MRCEMRAQCQSAEGHEDGSHLSGLVARVSSLLKYALTGISCP